jgi:hypothetical protein
MVVLLPTLRQTRKGEHMKTTIEFAREAGLLTWLKPPEDVIERFKAFEALVRADERNKQGEAFQQILSSVKACAIADEREAACDIVDYELDSNGHAEAIKIAIRARGNT